MTAAAAIVPTVEVQQISIDQLIPSEHNPRKTIAVEELSELVSSIEQIGIQVPLLVRAIRRYELPDEPGRIDKELVTRYEIIAGHRRHAAAKLAELEKLPCIVRELSDDQAFEIMVVENLQREDLPPLEEADAYQGLIELLGSTQAVAARVGKPIEYVTRRLKLRTLTSLSRRALAERLITIDHALLLCKLAAKEQDDVLKWALDVNAGVKTSCEKVLEETLGRRKRHEDGVHYGYWEPQSVLDLKHHIEQTTDLALSKAPWDLQDSELVPSAGACVDCAKNTKHNTALFGDLLVQDACCTDSACFNVKREALVQIQLKKAGAGALKLSWRSSSAAPRSADFSQQAEADGNLTSKGHAFYAQTFKSGQWVKAKKASCPHVRTGVTVDFPRRDVYLSAEERKQKPGEILTVCVTPKCKAHPKAWEKAKHSSNAGGYDAKAEEEKRKKAQEAADAENKIRLALAKKAIESVAAVPADAWRVIALRACGYDGGEGLLAGVKKTLKSAKIDSVEFAKAIAAIVLKSSGLSVWYHSGPSQDRGVFLEALKLFGIDGSSAWLKPKVVNGRTNSERKGGRGESPEPLSGAEKQPRPATKKKKATATVTKKGGKK